MKKEMKKEAKKLSRKSIAIIAAVCVFALIGGIFLGISLKKDSSSKLMSYDDAKEESQRLAQEAEEKAEKIRQQLNEFQNQQSIKDAKEKEELENKIKSELYKQYEKLSKEEKEKIDAIPREEEVPIDVIDDIIEEQEEIEIPSKFSLKDVIDIQVEDQGSRGLCWDFAAMKSLETFLSLHENKNYDFSEQHVNYLTSNLLYQSGMGRVLDRGGNFQTFTKYLMQSGVVLEKDVPYEKDYSEKEYSTFLNMKPVKIVTETVEFPTIKKDAMFGEVTSEEDVQKFRETVKRHIMKNGSVYAHINAFAYDIEDSRFAFQSKDSTLPKMTNHAISIVGWDDEFPKEKFRDGDSIPEHDGAYIALNSWGNTYRDDEGRPTGYFYISYDDIFVEEDMAGIVSTEFNEKTAIELDSIKSKSIKDAIISGYYYGIKEHNKKQYVTKLIIDSIKYLSIENEEEFDINELKPFTMLSDLQIKNSNLKSIDNLPELKNLTMINLSNNQLESIDRLKDFSELSLIIASNNNIKDVSSLKDIKINSINLSNNKGISGYGKLNVNYLSLYDNDIENLEVFDYEPTSLNISNNKLESLDNIPTSVASLNISNNNISDISALRDYNKINNLVISKNPITDLSIYKEPVESNGMVESGGETRSNLSISFTDSELTDITMFNNLKVSYLDISGNKISNIDGFVPGSVLQGLTLNNNVIEQIDGFVPNEKLNRLSLDNNNIKDVSNFNSMNIKSLYLSGNKDIKGYGILKVNMLELNNCGISQLESINESVEYLNLDNNSLEDISPLSSATNLKTLQLNNNDKEISGELNSNVETINIVGTKFADNFVWKCDKLRSVSTDNLKFDKKVVIKDGSISYKDVEINPDDYSSYFDGDHHIYFTNSNMVVSQNKKGNQIEISKIPLLITDDYKYLDNKPKTKGITISRDREYFVILDSSIKEIKEYVYLSDGNNFSGIDMTIKINDSIDLFGSIRELFRDMMHTVRKMI